MAYARRARGGRRARSRLRASRRTRRCCARRSSTGSSRTTSASRSRSTARASSRTSSACSPTGWAATTSSCRTSRSCCGGIARRPVGARVTLTSRTSTSRRIYKHLFEEIGFWEVGFAPVTTSWQREYAIGEQGFDAARPVPSARARIPRAALAGKRHHGFSNVRDTLEEIHKGMSKAYPCGAGLGPHGRVRPRATSRSAIASPARTRTSSAPCSTASTAARRTTSSFSITSRTRRTARHAGRGRSAPAAVTTKRTRAMARPVEPNLHYCEWIRGWTETCLEIYGKLAERNPEFLAKFDREETKAEAVLDARARESTLEREVLERGLGVGPQGARVRKVETDTICHT